MKYSTTPIANPAVIFQEGSDAWAVLVNLDTAASIALNPTGILVWKEIAKQRSVNDIVKAVKDQFENAPDTVSEDVMTLISDLAEEGFVGYEVMI